jgi:glycosyltransferase involved in cell wall biosynthesis
MADHLEEEINALFVPPSDPTALASAMTRLLTDEALRARMACANRSKVKTFAPDVVGKAYLAALEEVLRAATNARDANA